MATFYDEEFVAAVTGIALAGDGLVLGVGMALLAAHSWMKYRFRAKALKKVRATPLSHIADLRCLLLSGAAAAAATPAAAAAPVGEETQSAAGKETLFAHYPMHQPHLAPPEGHCDHHCPQQQKQEGNELMVIVRGRVLPEIDVHPRGHGDNGEGFIVAENSGIRAVVVEKVQTESRQMRARMNLEEHLLFSPEEMGDQAMEIAKLRYALKAKEFMSFRCCLKGLGVAEKG